MFRKLDLFPYSVDGRETTILLGLLEKARSCDWASLFLREEDEQHVCGYFPRQLDSHKYFYYSMEAAKIRLLWKLG
jgi:hypothetical protein